MSGSRRINLDRLVQYTIYVEKLPESSLEFAGAEPERRTVRPVREAALCLECASGLLDVMSDGGRHLRDKIARAFTRFALGDAAEVELMSRRDFHLDRLKRPIPFPTDPKDGIKNVTITRLCLALASGSYGRVMVEVGKTSTETIHASSERWFGHAEPIGRLEWCIVQATLRIVFIRGRRWPGEGRQRYPANAERVRLEKSDAAAPARLRKVPRTMGACSAGIRFALPQFRPPITMTTFDPVGLLVEHPGRGDRLPAKPVSRRWPETLAYLERIGVVQADALLTELTCSECDRDHSVVTEFDPAARKHRYFCPEAGLVIVDDDDLASLRVDFLWLLDWLERELPVVLPRRRRPLIEGRAWLLGEC